eukprot:SAG31_NODE_4827_length_2922_cov_1.410556_5_plen_179_part_00
MSLGMQAKQQYQRPPDSPPGLQHRSRANAPPYAESGARFDPTEQSVAVYEDTRPATPQHANYGGNRAPDYRQQQGSLYQPMDREQFDHPFNSAQSSPRSSAPPTPDRMVSSRQRRPPQIADPALEAAWSASTTRLDSTPPASPLRSNETRQVSMGPGKIATAPWAVHNGARGKHVPSI